MEDDNLVMPEISRVPKPGGLLIITLPGVYIPKHEKPPYQIDYRRYGKEGLKGLLATHGFVTLHFEYRSLFNLEINLFTVAQKIK